MLCEYLPSGVARSTTSGEARGRHPFRNRPASRRDGHPGFDEFVSPLTIAFGQEIISRLDLRPGTRFLDVGVGSGALAVPAARQGADVVAVDLAPAMIDRLNARVRDEALPNLDGRVMDGEHLEFPDETFDVSASLNGVSLFPDVDAGLTEMVRVTKPGGLVVVSCFGGGVHRAEFVSFFMSAVQTAVPGVSPPLDPPPLPSQLAVPGKLCEKLRGAGLHDVQVESTSWDAHVGSATHYWDAVTSSNPIPARLIAGLTAEQRNDVLAVLDGMLRERSGGGPAAVLRSEANIGTGTK
jgi:SAM-dependent methyltransferase